jgi:hypothetical protein
MHNFRVVATQHPSARHLKIGLRASSGPVYFWEVFGNERLAMDRPGERGSPSSDHHLFF